jgi:hypothetical protein
MRLNGWKEHGVRSSVWLTGVALLSAASAFAGLKPESFRLASLPATVEPGQKLVLCAANIGTGEVDVALEFINVRTGGLVSERTVTLKPLGAGAAAQPCLTTTAEAASAVAPQGAGVKPPLAASFAPSAPPAPSDGQPLVVGVALVRKSLLSFREAQVTASIQVLAPDANGEMRTVETIPLSRTAHPSDGAPVYAPAPASGGGHHK